jgi:hypothetical protein
MKQSQRYDTGVVLMKKLICILSLYFLSNILNLTFAAPLDSLKVTPLNAAAGEVSIYQISFVASDTLYPDGQISITFPADFDLTNVKIANSTSINGGFKVSVQNNKVILKRTGLGRMVLPKEKVEVKFANVKNPKKAETDFPLIVEFQNRDLNQIQRMEEVSVTLKSTISK